MKKILFSILALALMAMPLHTSAQAQKNDSNPDDELRKLVMAAAMTYNYYVDTVDCKKLVEDAIVGMLSKLDPHSLYSNAKETKKLNEPLNGSFEGIGVQFNMLEDTLLVIQTVTNGPSEKVGILAGDRIISVNDTAIAGVKMSRDDIMQRLRGPKGTIAHLGVKRQGIKDVLTFKVKRDKIPVTTLDAAYMVTPTIGLIRFSSFGATTRDEVVEAINKLKDKGMKDLIVDLQQNGGGYLNAAADIASLFLPKGDLIVYTRGRNVPNQDFRSSGNPLFQEGKVVMLIDEYTASAAEILSGSIQDQDRGWVVGRRSFGKGLVQRPIELFDGSMIRLTIAHYYTPTGRCIQKPYDMNNKDAYTKDALTRYEHGELTNLDSIHMPDSLKYQTLRQHRTVYGGGGIMPDYFVPLDTMKYTKYYREISAKSLIINANLHYLDKNRKKLTKLYKANDFDRFDAEFEISDATVEELLEEATKEKILPKDDAEREETIPMIKRMMKGLVARDLWDMSEYFSIIYRDDPAVQTAVRLIEQGPDANLEGTKARKVEFK